MYTNPFLCKDCQSFGYCRRNFGNSFVLNEPKIMALEKEVKNWVPLTARKNNSSEYFANKVQQAHDLFHQEEFEGANYMYRDLYETRNESEEIVIGLIASLYFLKEYDEAAALAIQLDTRFNTFPDKFINLCIAKAKEKLEREIAVRDELLRINMLNKSKEPEGSDESFTTIACQETV